MEEGRSRSVYFFKSFKRPGSLLVKAEEVKVDEWDLSSVSNRHEQTAGF